MSEDRFANVCKCAAELVEILDDDPEEWADDLREVARLALTEADKAQEELAKRCYECRYMDPYSDSPPWCRLRRQKTWNDAKCPEWTEKEAALWRP